MSIRLANTLKGQIRTYSHWKREHWNSILHYNQHVHTTTLDQYSVFPHHPHPPMRDSIQLLEIEKTKQQEQQLQQLQQQQQYLGGEIRTLRTSLDLVRKSQNIIRSWVKDIKEGEKNN